MRLYTLQSLRVHLRTLVLALFWLAVAIAEVQVWWRQFTTPTQWSPEALCLRPRWEAGMCVAVCEANQEALTTYIIFYWG